MSFASSSGALCLISGSCPSARVFAPPFLQTSPRDDALALRYHFSSIRMGTGLPTPSCHSCTAYKEKEMPMGISFLVGMELHLHDALEDDAESLLEDAGDAGGRGDGTERGGGGGQVGCAERCVVE